MNLQSTVKEINKDLGIESLMICGDIPDKKVDVISSGSIGLNRALIIGGIPKGRIIEYYGPEQSGKTTLTLHLIAEAQKIKDKFVAFIDAEHALDLKYAKALGVDTKSLVIAQPDSGEEALNIVEKLTRTGDCSVVVVDSVAALVPRAEIEGEAGESHMGLQARLMSQAMRKLTGIASKTQTTIIFINQIRMNIGQFFGPNETTTGGKALKFYASIRLEIRKIATKKDDDAKKTAIANRTRIKVVKNKLAPPFRETELDIVYGVGIDHYREVMENALDCGIIHKTGAWYSYQDEKIGHGEEKTIETLKTNKKIYEEIIKQLV